MGLKLEVGREYKDVRGLKCKCVKDDGSHPMEAYKVFHGEGEDIYVWHYRDGKANISRDVYDLIAEWPADDAPTGPVRTVTRTTREIMPGEYDGLDVGRAVNGTVFLAMPIANHCQESIDALIANLSAIRDALEDQ